jgi:hypothetical protein
MSLQVVDARISDLILLGDNLVLVALAIPIA